MIRDLIDIHDKYQFEVKRRYDLTHEQKVSQYDIETYLFFSYTLGINHHTYSGEDFYSDIQTYLRLSPPSIPLSDMVGEEHSALSLLREAIRQLRYHPGRQAEEAYAYRLKMSSCSFIHTLKDYVSVFAERETARDRRDLLNTYLDGIRTVTQGFRNLRHLLNSPVLNETFFSMYLFADEYMSLYIETRTFELLDILEQTDMEDREVFRKKLLQLIRNERAYRQENGYPSLPDDTSANETFLFRKSVLKKYVERVLFLSTHSTARTRMYEHLIAALSAGTAMAVATTIAFFSRSAYGSFSFPLFMALVISYMFKDRIKEGARQYLKARIQQRLFDHTLRLFAHSGKKIGWYKERFDFVKEAQAPNMIMRIRNRDHLTEIENEGIGETIIRYRKRIKLYNTTLSAAYQGSRLASVTDIMRINVRHFLHKMDNPRQTIYACDPNLEYYKIEGNRVYHLNVIEKFRTGQHTFYKRFRIVLNRDGIQRIEKVAEEQI